MSTDATGAERLLEVEAHSDVVSQLHGAVLRLLRQVDAVEVLQERADGQTEQVRHKSVKSLFTTNLIVFDSLGQRLHVDRLVQLVFVQQVDEEIQGTLMDAHLRVQRADLLVDLHAALSQRSEREQEAENQDPDGVQRLRLAGTLTVRICGAWPAGDSESRPDPQRSSAAHQQLPSAPPAPHSFHSGRTSPGPVC